MISGSVILRNQLIGVGNIFFQFFKCFALAEHSWNFLQFANEPAIVFPELKGKFVFHQGYLFEVAAFEAQQLNVPLPVLNVLGRASAHVLNLTAN
jgi:hypothetical protein